MLWNNRYLDWVIRVWADPFRRKKQIESVISETTKYHITFLTVLNFERILVEYS